MVEVVSTCDEGSLVGVGASGDGRTSGHVHEKEVAPVAVVSTVVTAEHARQFELITNDQGAHW